MGDARTYAAALISDNLGLAEGALKPVDVPNEMVHLVGSTLRGEVPGTPEPVIEEAILRFSSRLRDEALERDGHIVRKARWPGAAPFALCVTHDVDNVARPRSHILARRERFSGSGLALALLGLRSLYDNLSYVSDLERKRGLRSSFYLLSSEYDLSKLRSRAEKLLKEGWEVGLHGDFETHDSKEKMDEAASRFSGSLGFKPEGLREHYLQFDYSKTWGIAQEAGFLYDSSVGNRDKLGFRVGLCTPFRPPGPDWEPMKLVELPLVLMDTTLWGYLKLGEEEGVKEAARLAERVLGLGGLFTLLWHQESVRMRGGRVFPKVLDLLLKRGPYSATGVEVARWWGSRSVPLFREGGEYRLGGPAPKGLCLEFEGKEGLLPQVVGGTVEERRDRVLVKVESDGFRMKVG
ncbi:MAG: hypothetical protein HY247_01010 [archaeon]|nr:MAG: hypothetical protein HY247_01010 [archaeon]